MTEATDWSLGRRIAFRFVCAYWALFLVPYVSAFAGDWPGLQWLARGVTLVMNGLVVSVASHLLRLPPDAALRHPTGSGDTLFDVVEALTVLLLACVAATLWSILDRRRRAYPDLRAWLHVVMRYSLALVLLSYGLAKVLPVQYPPPQLDRYLEPFGDASPMGLLWTFMQSSRAYTLFTGLVESTAGLLLFWQRTSTIGALVAATAMTNVVVLNFTYDVPVKLYSAHLLAMSAFLLWPDARRLVDALVVNRPVTPRPPLVAVAKYVVVIAIAGVLVRQWWTVATSNQADRPALYGVYEVETFVRNGQVAPPLLTDTYRWRRVVFNRFGGVSIHRMNDQIDRYGTKLEPSRGTLTLLGGPDAKKPVAAPFALTRSLYTLDLRGTFDGAALDVKLTRLGDERQFLLVNRGFHWIQEYPFNR